MVTSISSFNWPLFTWRLFTVPKNIYICIYFGWSFCVILFHPHPHEVCFMPPAFSGWFSQGFVDFCSCSCLYSCLLSCEVLTFFCVCVIQLNFTTLQGSLLCFSSQIVLCSNASWKTLKMLLVWCLHQVNVNVLKVVHGWFWVSKLKRSCSVCC